MSRSSQHYRARWIVPVDSPPIELGELVVEDGRIASLTAAKRSFPSDGIDFGDAILLPGLVNVHAHLDYTVMRGLLEDIPFFPWIRELNARKSALNQDDWVASATWGAAEAVAGGVTSIGDCSDSGAAMQGAIRLGLGGIVYQEVFGIDARLTVEAILTDLDKKVTALKASSQGTSVKVGISPHSPYTVRPDLMRALGTYALKNHLPLCIHAAESTAEAVLLRSGTGPIAEMFGRRSIAWNAPHSSSIEYLNSLGVLNEHTLLVHGIQVSSHDMDIMRASGSAMAHCPKSNAKLGNGVAPLELLSSSPPESKERILTSSVRIGLGSDSVASNNTMDMFEEMRFAVLMQRAARRSIEVLTAEQAVRMATLGGAEALEQESETGSLTPGKCANFCVVRLGGLQSSPAYNPYNALVYAAHASDVAATVIGGVMCYDANLSHQHTECFPDVDLSGLRIQLESAADQMRNWRP